MALDTRISLQKLELFVTVVDLESVTRAAQRLFIAQPAVSAQLRSLEQRVGAKLVERRGNRMVPTEAGRTVYRWATDLLARTHAMEREVEGVSDGSRGVAVVAASMTVGCYLLPPVVSDFHQQRPGAHITLLSFDPERALADAESGAADFAVLIDSTEERANFGTLRTEHLADEPLLLVTAPESPPDRDEISVKELASLPFVTAPSHHPREQTIARQLAALEVGPLDVRIELGHPQAMTHAVRAGIGAGLMYRSTVAEELEHGWLREVAIRDAQLTTPVLLVYRRDRPFSAMQRDLMDAVRRALQDEPRPAAAAVA